MSGEMEAALERARAAILGQAGIEFNVDSPKQLREVLFGRLGLRARRKTAKGGEASTDAQTLEELSEEHPIAARILEYRELAKLKGTYVDALPRLVDPDTGRVHTTYHPTGAATGRLSSSDPNLQNIPARTAAGRAIRAAFVPAAGHVFLASDYSQIELRVLAHLTGDPALGQAFRDGEDIHRRTAAVVFGVLPDLVSAEMRRRAKAVNFGILYGMSELRLAREQGIPRKDARAFIETYFARFARVREYIERVRETARREGEVRTLFGRLRRFPQLRGNVNRAIAEQALRAAVNTTVQGTAADLMKLAMLAVDRALERSGLGAAILLQVHDELVLEVPAAVADAAARIVREAMEGVGGISIPLVVDQKTGASWMEVT
jgi:DNA polymerase-1